LEARSTRAFTRAAALFAPVQLRGEEKECQQPREQRRSALDFGSPFLESKSSKSGIKKKGNVFPK
jgi:hypothetical protein